MNLYSYRKDGINYTSSNIYIKLNYLKQESTFINIFNNRKLVSNITDTYKFTTDLLNYELTNNNGRRSNTSINYGVTLTLLLDKETREEQLILLVKEIVKNYKNLPYYSFIEKRGKGNYLIIYISERFYYKDGKEKVVKAKKDLYRNSITGKACTKEDNNAVLWRKKGAVLSKVFTLFSSKERFFRYANTKQFNNEIEKLKRYYAELCEKLLNVVVNTTISFKRYVLKILSYQERKVANVWNKCFKDMEKEFNKCYIALTINETEELETKVKSKLDGVYISFNNQIINNYSYISNTSKDLHRFNYKKYKFSINFNNYATAKSNAELLKAKFKEKLNEVYSLYYAN